MGDSRVLGSSISGGEPTAAVAAPLEGGGGDGGSNHSGEEGFRSGGGGGEDLLGGGERMSFGGNRWPRQETLALLQIRSDMDVAFRDASAKGPLWEEVSRKLAALGYHRSAKKCKEKFENVYKYHRRTKEGRTGKSDGKTYRFFDQLNALENQPPAPNQTTMPAVPAVSNPPPTISHLHSTVTTGTITTSTASTTVPLSSSAAPHPTVTTVSSSQGVATPALNNLRLLPNSFPATNPIVLPPPSQPPPPRPPTTTNPTNINHGTTFPSNFPTTSTDLMSNSTSSSTSSDDDLERRAKRKRKWKDFFERLMREVIQKQEDLQMRFLEAIEKREQDRMVREEAWRMQEMARMNREREILAQERSVTAAKDAAVMSFLQKISEQQQPNLNYQNSPQPVQQPPQPPPPWQKPSPAPTPPAQTQQPSLSFEIAQRDMNNSGEMNNNEVETMPVSSSRWPKVEVQALIKLRTSLDSKYLENGPKGPLWEEISGAMKKLGYNRNAKRCKEKWENINKYFKKVKESNKRRPEDSKTCPYFHLLDSLYRERNNNVGGGPNSSGQFRPENAAPLMVRPEQQWPPPQQQQQQQLRDEALMDIDLQQQQQQHQHHQNQEEDHGDKGNIGDEDDDDEEDDEEDEEEDEDDDGNYEIVANKPAPVGAAAAE